MILPGSHRNMCVPGTDVLALLDSSGPRVTLPGTPVSEEFWLPLTLLCDLGLFPSPL